jgi:predicted amidophosphoribosyltransferase
MEGAFALRRGAGEKIAGRSFLLVDDILTTGATIRACAEVLKRAGADCVVACTVALAA